MSRRIILLVIAFLTALLSAGIIYVDRFGQSPSEKFLKNRSGGIFTSNPYQALNNKLLNNISLLKSFRAYGDISGDLRGFFIGLKNFQSQNSFEVDLSDALKIHWLSDQIFKTLANNSHFLRLELRRISPNDFYVKSSKTKIDSIVKSIVAPLLEKWILVDDNVAKNLIPPAEQLNLGFSEKQFITEVRKLIPQIPIINLTRKLSGENHYQFVVNPVNLTQFLGILIGDLSGQLFSEQEFINLFQILYQYRIGGEVWIDPVKYLPNQLVLNWNNWLNFNLHLKDFDAKIIFEKPAKSESLEKLIK